MVRMVIIVRMVIMVVIGNGNVCSIQATFRVPTIPTSKISKGIKFSTGNEGV